MTDKNSLGIELSAKLPPAAADVAVCVFEDEPGAADGELGELVEGLKRDGEFKGEAGTSLLVHTAGTDGARRLLVVGLGERADFDAGAMSRAAAAVVRRAREGHIRQLNFVLPPSENGRRMIRAASEGAMLGLYDNSFYQKREDETKLETLNLVSAEADAEQTAELLKEIERGRIVAEAVNWARALADEPGGTLPPEVFARRAAEMATAANANADILKFATDGFTNAATAKVGTSAIESRKLGYLLWSDTVVANKDELLYAAIQEARAMFEAGYRPPLKRLFPVAGRNAKATIQGQLVNMRDGGFISQHDFHISSLIADVVTGGDVDAGSLVNEEYLMSLERKHFCALLDHPKTQERIMGMLQTGKPVRN